MTMMYSIRDGPCSMSYGIHVATAAGFPDSVIKDAVMKSEELEDEKGYWRTDSGTLI